MKFNIKVEINVTENRETFINNVILIEENLIKKETSEDIKEKIKKKTPYMTKQAYENSDWKNRLFIHQYLAQYN